MASTASHTLTRAVTTPGGRKPAPGVSASPLEFSRVTSGSKCAFTPSCRLGAPTWAWTTAPDRHAGACGGRRRWICRVQNGFGNVVMVKHRNNSTTVYAHLSRIAVKQDKTWARGKTSALWARRAGPPDRTCTLEFRVNGQQRDPLTIARQSEAVPVAASASGLQSGRRPGARQLAAAAQSWFRAPYSKPLGQHAMSEWYIGLMSGTSLDGVDAVLADFGGTRTRFWHTAAYPCLSSSRPELLALNQAGDNEIHPLALAAMRSRLYAQAVQDVAARGCRAAQVRAVGAHGQTRTAPPTGV